MRVKNTFDLSQFVYSATAIRKGIDNTPSPEVVANLQRLYNEVLLPIEQRTGAKLLLTSGYRSEKLNKAIGGSATSQHCKGQAADLQAENMTPAELYKKIKKSGVIFDQLIEEFGAWVHVSTSPTPRKQCLIASKKGKRTVYTPDPS